MATNYPFIAFCSSVLNTKTIRKAFQNPAKQAELFAKFDLSASQKKAAKAMNIEAITTEIGKELKKAVKDAAGPKSTAHFW